MKGRRRTWRLRPLPLSERPGRPENSGIANRRRRLHQQMTDFRTAFATAEPRKTNTGLMVQIAKL
jgi:hypothetical protein